MKKSELKEANKMLDEVLSKALLKIANQKVEIKNALMRGDKFQRKITNLEKKATIQHCTEMSCELVILTSELEEARKSNARLYHHSVKVKRELNAEKAISKINELAVVSCENSNNELHEKLSCYRIVLKDIN